MKNLIKVIILVISLGVVIHDLYMLSISPFFTGTLYRFTWFGLITFLMALSFVACISTDLCEKNMMATETSHHQR